MAIKFPFDPIKIRTYSSLSLPQALTVSPNFEMKYAGNKNGLRIHCFNVRQQENKDGERKCNDMEVSYYVECPKIEKRSFSGKFEKGCLPKKDTKDPTDPLEAAGT